MATLGSLFSAGLAGILGAADELRVPTLDYLRVILISAPLQLFNIAANSIVRAEGQARVAMWTMVAGMLLNIGLDPVFIFALGWGVRGAAFATLIGHSLTTLLIVTFYVRGRGAVRMRWVDLNPDALIIRETVKIGSSGFVRQISDSFVQGLRANLLVSYGGALFISAYGIVFRSMLFLAMPAMGIAQALPPIAGYNYGAGQLNRVRRSVWVSIVACSAIMWMGFLILELIPAPMFRLFSLDPELIARGIPIMRINVIGMLAFPTYFIGPSFYQAIGKPMRAMVLALARPLISISVMLIAVHLVGPLGVVAADPIALLAGAVIVIVHLRKSFSGSGELGARVGPPVDHMSRSR